MPVEMARAGCLQAQAGDNEATYTSSWSDAVLVSTKTRDLLFLLFFFNFIYRKVETPGMLL